MSKPGGTKLKMDESGPLRGDEDGVSSPEVMAARVSLRLEISFFFSEGIFDPLNCSNMPGFFRRFFANSVK